MNIVDAPLPAPVVLEPASGASAVASPSLSKKELKEQEKEKKREEKERAKREKEERATLKKEKKVSFLLSSTCILSFFFIVRRARRNRKLIIPQKAACVFSYINPHQQPIFFINSNMS